MGLRSWIGEQAFDVSRTWGVGRSWSALRSVFVAPFFNRPVMEGTAINFDLARSLYRNDNPRYNLGAGFVRPIVDLSVEYVGLPGVTSDNGDTDAWLNECIQKHWAPQLQQVWRDSIRDSQVVIRFRQPLIDNPLFTEEDRTHGRIECVAPETVFVQMDPADADKVGQAIINHWIELDTRDEDEIARGVLPRIEEVHIIETITPKMYMYYDKTNETELVSWRTPNPFGFVPVWKFYNEFDAALAGGQSDIEPIMPFIQAFHEVLLQTLAAHKYHSTPKAKFNLKDIYSFLRNNFPNVLDESGRIKSDAKVNWDGNEVLFFGEGEDGGFIEARSVLGDSKTLLEFLIDCICMAAEVPRWALLKDSGATDKDASVQPFEKKITRKRVMFSEVIVMVCKMALAVNSKSPVTVRVTWPSIRLSDLASKAQAIQQIVLACDVASTHEWLADETVIQIIASLFPEVNAPSVEKRMAATNVQPLDAAPAPASTTQGSQNGNGNGDKSRAKRAIATTTASRS
jgi:hypothetical protein